MKLSWNMYHRQHSMMTKKVGSTRGLVMLVSCLILLWGCTPEYLNQQDLNAFVVDPSNGLIQKVQQDRLEISAAYRPTDLMIAQELQDDFDYGAIDKLRSKYSDYAYFILSFSVDEKDALYSSADNYASFSDMLQKLSFSMGDYLSMTTSVGDTVYLADYHFSRMYGMAGSTQLLLAFETEELDRARWVQLNLREMGLGTGRINMRFLTKDLKNTPRLDILNKK